MELCTSFYVHKDLNQWSYCKKKRSKQVFILLSCCGDNMCNKLAPQCCKDEGNEPTTKIVLVAWKLYEEWNPLRSQHRWKVRMTKWRYTKLAHDLPVKIVLFENDREEKSLCAWAFFAEGVVLCLFLNVYNKFATPPHLKECPLQHEVLLYNGRAMFMCLCPLCTK